MDWSKANCANRRVDPDLFFPDVPKISPTHAKVIRQICGECEIQFECFQYAKEHNAVGYWGGYYISYRS